MTGISATRLLGKLEGVKQVGREGWMTLCPAHEDGEQSLHIDYIPGNTLVFCHAGCHTIDVMASVGLGLADLFDTPKGVEYEYRNSRGEIARTVTRTPTKDFRQDVRDKTETPLYHRAEVVTAAARGEVVWFTEGEKDADYIRTHWDMTATTTPGGAANWHKADFSLLEGTESDFHIAADADEAGIKRAVGLRDFLRSLTSGRVRIYIASQGKDVVDHGMRGFGVGDMKIVGENGKPDEDLLTAKLLRDVLEDEALDGYDWVIPDLLERRERLILTGGEGAGKMVLLRQMTVLAAAGIHPFTFEAMKPISVLVFDSENSERQWRRQAKSVADRAAYLGQRDPAKHYHVILQQVINIKQQAYLDDIHRLIDIHEPDIVVTAPLYKLVPEAINDDTVAAPVLAALDTIRDRGITLLMEAHAGRVAGQSLSNDRAWAPRGSAALIGWPEYGLGLAPIEHDKNMVSVKRWRGGREDRNWPTYLSRGNTAYSNDWPWMPSYQPQD